MNTSGRKSKSKAPASDAGAKAVDKSKPDATKPPKSAGRGRKPRRDKAFEGELPVDAYEPLPGEPVVSYRGFVCYRQLGPGRTVQRAWKAYARKYGLKGDIPSTTFRDNCSLWRWVDRVESWDMMITRYTTEVEMELLTSSYGRIMLELPSLVDRAIELAHDGDVKMLIDLLTRAGLDKSYKNRGNDDSDIGEALKALLGAKVNPK